jgi:hypothetical protein
MPVDPIKDQEQIERAERQRALNERAAAEGRPLPYPNIWDLLDPTKIPPGSSDEAIHQSYLEFSKLCRRRPRKRHIL